MGRCNLLLPAEGSGPLKVGWADRLTDVALIVCLGQVGRNLAGAFTGLQSLGKELLGSLEVVALFCLLLVGHKVQVAVSLLLDGFALQQCVDLAEQQVGRSAVKDEMVHVDEQINTGGSLDDLGAVERRLLQIEGLHKLVFMFQQFIFTHLDDLHIDRSGTLERLHDSVPLGGEVDT